MASGYDGDDLLPSHEDIERTTKKRVQKRVDEMNLEPLEEDSPAQLLDAKLAGLGPNVPEPIRFILQFFEYGHLELDRAVVSKQFHDLAWLMARSVPMNPEMTVCLRNLLLAKDAGVRAGFAR